MVGSADLQEHIPGFLFLQVTQEEAGKTATAKRTRSFEMKDLDLTRGDLPPRQKSGKPTVKDGNQKAVRSKRDCGGLSGQLLPIIQ